jgi:hypothetical protein
MPAALQAALKAPVAPTRKSLAEICPCCRKACEKPWSVVDRWNDSLIIRGHEDWANNGVWDHEPYQDTNASGYYEPGEPFTDQNGDGIYNEEYYHPFNTGYVAWKDLGLALVLKPGSADGTQAASHYNAIDLSADERDDPTGSRYAWDIANCNTSSIGPGDVVQFHPGDMKGPTSHGVQALIDRDPTARWDPATQEVVSPLGDRSPRIIFFPLTDPRSGAPQGRKTAVVSKVAAFFVDHVDGDGDVVGRFVRVASLFGSQCPIGYPPEAAFISTCAP